MSNVQNSMRNISLSVLLIGCAFVANTQKNNRYTRANAEAPVFTYTESNCYSRSLIVDDNKVLLANSNGHLYEYDLLTGTSVNRMSGKKFSEMRDLEQVNDYVLGMQSAQDGLLAKIDSSAFDRFIFPRNNLWSGVFLDGMDFFGQTGFLMGDPVDGYFSLFYTLDGGLTWQACEGKVKAQEGEAGFAASGTNVQVLNDSTFVFVSGGTTSRFFKSTDYGKSWISSVIPYFSGEGSGAFSVCFVNDRIGVVVGGDYTNPKLNLNNSYYTDDGGLFWTNSRKQVLGYRSCVTVVNEVFYACGITGIDVSFDQGETWQPFAYGHYFALASDGRFLYATAPKGTFQQFELAK